MTQPIDDGLDDCSGTENVLCAHCWGVVVHNCPCPHVRLCDCQEAELLEYPSGQKEDL